MFSLSLQTVEPFLPGGGVVVSCESAQVRQAEESPQRGCYIKTKVKRAPLCYEAGPRGYGIRRQLRGPGHQCDVVAPSLIPRKPGERIKTDRRDANKPAEGHRAGELTPAWVPDRTHGAIRDLVRARLVATRELRRGRQQLSSFLLRSA
jgi:transposase